MAQSDLFPGFQSHWVDTSIGRIFARSGGSGPPLLLVHGFPQTHVEWHRVAPELARHFTLVLPDLPGYGWSVAPPAEADYAPYHKRAMADLLIEVMEKLGHVRFRIAGHDRGARVAYRMALDHGGRVEKLALLDIVPTIIMWERIAKGVTPATEHWPFLAGPDGEPEAVIAKDPVGWQNSKLAGWTLDKSLKTYDARALKHYNDFFVDPSRIHACCNDYRAGATTDLRHDEADKAAGKTIACPVLLLWGNAGIPAEGASPLADWRLFAPNAEGHGLDCGHFLPEEMPDETAKALLAFFGPV